MSASEELLGKLHDAVATKLLAKIQGEDATPAEISAAIKFLKDNGIEAEPAADTKLDELAKSLPDFTGELHVN